MELGGDGALASPARESSARALEQANRLVRLAQDLAVCVEPTQTARIVAQGLGELAGGGVAFTYLAGSDGELTLEGWAGSDGIRPVRAPRLVERAFRVRAIVSADTVELADLQAGGAEVAEALAAPLEPVGEPLGVVVVVVPRGMRLAIHPGLLQSVARLAGASLANGRRLALTLAEARRDPLTELGNHRAFHEHLESALRRTVKESRQLTLVLFDLDDFKQINDTEGHLAGDAVLRGLARRLSEQSRAREALFRVGGDEFALVVDGDAEAGVLVAERIRASVAVGTREHGLTLSAGVATFPVDALTKDELVHKADLALYAAKRAGKDTAISFAEDVRGAVARPTAEVLYEELHDRMGSEDVRAGVLEALETVTDAVRALGSETTLEAMLLSAARHLTAVVGGTACVISRLAGATLQDVATFTPSPWKFESGSAYLLEDYPVTVSVLESGEPRAVALADEGVDAAEAFVLRKFGMRSVLMLRVAVEGRTWGLAEIYDARDHRFGPTDSGLAQLVVGHVEALLAQFEHSAAVERLYRETLGSLSNALEVKDDYTGAHAQEVCALAVGVARRLGLSGAALRAVELGALLHDIGKIRVPESILNKRGPLTDEEWAVMRTHPEAGERILAPIASLADVLPIVRSSHERWDGGGYPDGLAREEIHIGARIVAVCDAFRAMVEPRPYRAALERDAVIGELAACAGGQFDPACVEALQAALAELERPGVIRLHRPDHLKVSSSPR
jgi:diguanylate cyclase (GGDEF)-like protein